MNKPGIPITVIGLCAVAALGLITQYLAAEHAFSLIGRTAGYSVAAALLIESAIVVDAVVFSKTRNLIAGAGLLVALTVSGIYNYTLADMSTADIAQWQKAALAIGPLIALATIALALGEELYKHEEARSNWSNHEQDIQDTQDIKLAREATEQARAEQHATDAQVLWRREVEEAKIAAQQKSDDLARKRKERWDRKIAVVEVYPTDDQMVGYVYDGNGAQAPIDALVQLSPGALENRRAFQNALTEHQHLAETITPKALAERTGKTQRTARRWVSSARETE